MKNISIYVLLSLLLAGYTINVNGQEQSYFPKGDPSKWNVELTPFLWLPAISGEVGSENMSNEMDIPAVDLLSNLKMAFMMTGEVSKGMFFSAPSYFYAKLGSENVAWTSGNGEENIVSIPDLKMNIGELIAGGRFRLSEKFILDPFLGVRYTNYHIYGSVEGPKETNTFDESTDYWDPILGMQMHYFPHPRVPIYAKVDIGGFGVGSTFSWATSLMSGYTLSPSFDLLGGIAALGTDFEKETSIGNMVGMKMIMYGFNIGVKYHIPKRVKDKSVFKKAK